MTKAKTTSFGKRLKRRALLLLIGISAILILCIISLRWINPLTSSVMLQSDIRSLFDSSLEWSHYEWRSWNQISSQFPLAVIASEDQRFPQHIGIDFKEIHNAIKDRSNRRRGASTITQQVAKNLFLWNGRSYVRKVLEAGLAIMIELAWSKQRILEVYLNIAQMGKNIYGVGVASEFFFNKSASEINRYEAARIVAILPSPSRFSATNPSQYILKRQQWILKQMKQLGGTGYLRSL